MIKKKILLVDGDDVSRGAMADQFIFHENFTVFSCANGADALNILQETPIDIAILDVAIKDITGPDLCQNIRAAGFSFPIIMITNMDDEISPIPELGAGANHYVAKPLNFADLLPHVRVYLRQHEKIEEGEYIIGPYLFKPVKNILEESLSGNTLRLTDKETAMLQYLYGARGRSVSKDELLAEVWGYNSEVTSHTLETHIYRLRKKIEPTKGQTFIIMTEHDGYSLGF